MPADLLTGLRMQLIAASVVRAPNTPGSAPPMWLEPRDGTPAPGEGEDPTAIGATAVLGAFLTGGIPPDPLFGQTRRDQIDIWIRTLKASAAFDLDAQIRRQLVDKRDYLLGGIGGCYVVESDQWRALSRLDSGPQGFIYTVAYLFETVAV